MKKIALLLVMALLCTATGFAAKKKVAFVYQTGYNSTATNRVAWGWPDGYVPSLDPIHMALAAAYDVTDFAYAQTAIPDTTTLMTYDLVYMSEAMSGAQNLSNNLVKLVGRVPMVNQKSFVYNSGRWNWATPRNPTAKTTSVTINPGFETHAIFKDVPVSSGVVQLFDGTNVLSNLVQGFDTPIAATTKIESDKIIANVTGTAYSAIHEIANQGKKYICIPFSSDVMRTITPDCIKLVMNACNYVMGGSGGFDPSADFKIAYLYDATYANYCGIANDPIFNNTVIAEKTSEAINIADFTAASTDTLAALEKYDLVVLSEAIGSGHVFSKMLSGLVNRVPVLNFKSFLYKSTAWNWGAGVNPTAAATEGGIDKIRIDTTFATHELFQYVEVIDTTITLFKNSTGVMKNMVQGYTATAGGFIAGDKVFATVKGASASYNAIHEHGTSNKYLLLPISSDAIYLNDASNLSDGGMQLINNAVYYLVQTKSNVLPALKPSISLIYKDAVTKVIMTTLTPEGKIYYTTDGSVPTTTSSLYTDTLSITTNCTIKALTAKQGMNNSVIDSVIVVVKTLAPQPIIDVAPASVGKTVSITGVEGSTIYYTISGATPATATATLYTGSFIVKRPCIVKAMATMTDKLNSEVASQNVTIDGYIARDSMYAWADFNVKPTTWVWSNASGRDTTLGDVIAKYAYTPPTELDPTLKPTLKTVDFNNGFMVGTLGQRINLQSTPASTTGDYSPLTDADAGASNRAMSFLTTNAAADPTTAYLATTKAYRGPFDVVVWFTGAKGSTSYIEKLEVSVAPFNDPTSWTVLDTLVSLGEKKIRKRTAYYDQTDSVLVKLTSVTNLNTNSNMMVFDVKLFGESKPVGVKNVEKETKSVTSKRIFTLAGIEVKRPITGMNIIRTIYSDGTVKVEKVMLLDSRTN